MKKLKILLASLGAIFVLTTASGCAAKAFEKEFNVVFRNEGKIVDHGVVTQFKNYQSPVLDDAYIPNNYRFLGWTVYDEHELSSDPTTFKTQYIGGGRMVHYMDVRDFVTNQTVVLDALIMHKDDIPREYHYVVLSWYDKVGNSGLTQGKMDTFEQKLKTHLLDEGVSQEDVNTVVVRGYAGNVGPTTNQILYDDDVDLMLGWGSVNNITTTGSIPEEMIKQSEAYTINYEGTLKGRYIHRLTDNPGAIKTMEYLLSDEAKAFFNPVEG